MRGPKGRRAEGPEGTAIREGQTFLGESPFIKWANFVKLPHTVFALPFAIVGVVAASYRALVSWTMVLWVVIAFTAARFAAMTFNRLVDRKVDAENPRTRMREIPRGVISPGEAATAVAVSAGVFILAASRLNVLCLALSPVALGWVLFYSYTKRFTAWSHLVLGLGLGIAPVGGYLAVAGHWPSPWWGPVALAFAVMSWVAGFDVLYALQDLDFDRRTGLHSIPAALGADRAVQVARALHVLCVGFLLLAGVALSPTAGWMVGVGAVGALLVWEHRLVHPNDLSRLDAAFFMMNGVISILFCTIVLVERFVT
ncbi:MAG TPA: UbiA-like polyprenyltransferase [Gemmatimonadaceae bacterium]|nr:UbiA-like polyprenyltransferase [Gemmatimonadaceae bacterium]